MVNIVIIQKEEEKLRYMKIEGIIYLIFAIITGLSFGFIVRKEQPFTLYSILGTFGAPIIWFCIIIYILVIIGNYIDNKIRKI